MTIQYSCMCMRVRARREFHRLADETLASADEASSSREEFRRLADETPARQAGGDLASVAAMPRLEYPTYLDHIRTESARFREVLTDCDPTARVPTCPDWDAADLLWHLAGVQLFWAKVIRHRPASTRTTPRSARGGRPATGVVRRAARGLRRLLPRAGHRARAGRSRGATAWHWSGDNRVGTSYRRQAHEALIHRIDAELTAGVPVTPLDAALADDGVAEVLGVMYGGAPPWGTLHAVRGDDRRAPDRHRHRPAGRAGQVLAAPTRTTARPTRTRTTSRSSTPGAEPIATITGTAADLDTWLWKRDPALSLGWDDGDRIRIEGDRIAYEKLSAILGQPLN